MSFTEEIAKQISGEVVTDVKTLETASRDASIFKMKPKVIIYPKNSEDIQKIVRYINQHPEEHLSLTVRSAGTDMTGGPLNISIILDVSKHLNHIKEVGDHEATVEPGVFFRDFDAETKKKNLLLPSYPASRDLCTVGGMVANNSGGEKTLVFGKTEKFVQSLKVILADGEEYTIKPITLPELQQKMELKNFEGELYKKIVELIDANEDIINHARPSVSKNSTGYTLWNVFDEKTQRFDLSQIIIGSQGTLGIVTEIKFRLITPNPCSTMLVMFLHDLQHLADIITNVLTYHPESFESYDNHTLSLAIRSIPGLAKQMGGTTLLSLAWKFLPEFKMILTSGTPTLVLLAEFTGHNEAETIARAKACQVAMKKFNIKTRVANEASDIQKYWLIRRESFNLLRKHGGTKHTAPFIDDVVVSPKHLSEFLPRLNEILSHYNITYTIAGHMGDGNFHIIPLMDLHDESQRNIIPELAEKVYNLVFEYKGSMSGEHNDGLIRSHFLEKMYGEKVYNLFVQTKKIFDPNNIFNPGKKVGSSWEYAKEHMIQE